MSRAGPLSPRTATALRAGDPPGFSAFVNRTILTFSPFSASTKTSPLVAVEAVLHELTATRRRVAATESFRRERYEQHSAELALPTFGTLLIVLSLAHVAIS
jgi:hypothetical protein